MISRRNLIAGAAAVVAAGSVPACTRRAPESVGAVLDEPWVSVDVDPDLWRVMRVHLHVDAEVSWFCVDAQQLNGCGVITRIYDLETAPEDVLRYEPGDLISIRRRPL